MWGRKVLDVKGDKSFGQLFLLPEVDREFVWGQVSQMLWTHQLGTRMRG